MDAPTRGRRRTAARRFLCGAGVLLWEEVEIPARVVGHGTSDKRAPGVYFYTSFLFWITPYVPMRVLVFSIPPLFPDPSVIGGGGGCLGWMTTSWHQCNRTASSTTIFRAGRLRACESMLLSSVLTFTVYSSTISVPLRPPPVSIVVSGAKRPRPYQTCAATISLVFAVFSIPSSQVPQDHRPLRSRSLGLSDSTHLMSA